MSGRRRLLAVLLAVAALSAGPAALAPPALAQDQSAVAVNTKDGSSVFRLAFSVRRVMGDVVDQQNVALAYASCESCRTVAISIQILLVAGDPDVVTPTNLALAINDMCSLCETLASAYQFVMGGNVKLTLTREGRLQVNEIRRGLRELGRDEKLSIVEIQARTDALMEQLGETLSTELVVKQDDDEDGEDRDEEAEGEMDEDGEEDEQGEQPEDSTTTTTPSQTPTTPQEPEEDSPAPSDQTTTTP